jgi:hypothetical protein
MSFDAVPHVGSIHGCTLRSDASGTGFKNTFDGEEKRRLGLKPRHIPGSRGPEGPLFHGRAGDREFFANLLDPAFWAPVGDMIEAALYSNPILESSSRQERALSNTH